MASWGVSQHCQWKGHIIITTEQLAEEFGMPDGTAALAGTSSDNCFPKYVDPV